MKLDNQTLQILKNFVKINPNIIIRKGNVLTTKADSSFFAHAVLDKVYFPKEFAIYDLNIFLSVLSSFKDTDLDLDFSTDGIVVIKSEDNGNSVEYHLANPAIRMALAKEVRETMYDLPEPVYIFSLSEDDIKVLRSMCSTLNLNILEISPNEIRAFNKDNKSENVYHHTIQAEIQNTNVNAPKVRIDVNQVNFINGEYVVAVFAENVPAVHFRNNDMNVDYVVGLFIGDVE